MKSSKYRLFLMLQASRDQGFTLMELLIAVLISGLVVSGLLFLVVELLRIDNRETALEEVQRDTQRAINYIADDLREAVYVYESPGDFDNPTTTPETIANSTTGIGSALPSGSIPVLAFWKVRSLPSSQIPTADCSSFAAVATQNACRALKIRRASYDLVVYSQLPGPSGPWEGSSRINRYELRQYSDPLKLIETSGYVDPGSADSSFSAWTKHKTNALPTSPVGSAILVDYIDSIGTLPSGGSSISCQTLIPNVNDPDEYILSPKDAPENSSFFACVRRADSQAQQDGQFSQSNQDVYVFLRGDASARSSSVVPASDISRFPMVQTQVLVRGVINKNPTD